MARLESTAGSGGGYTQAEKDAATAKTVAAGGKSTDAANRLPGETASQANARITAGYKEMLAKPVLSQAATDAGAEVRFVRVGGGGQGEYTVVTPVGYTGPKITTTQWTEGIIPSTGKYTTGTTLGVMSDGKGGYTAVDGTPITKASGSKVATTATGSTVDKGPAVDIKNNGDGSVTYTYADGTKKTLFPPGATNGTSNAPIGTPPAFVYNQTTGKWEQPPKPTTPGSWVWDNVKGWTNTTVNPGSTGVTTEGGPTLAKDTFKNTLALFFGAAEMSQPWVDVLYKSVSGFYNTGSTVQESLNLALQDIRNNPVMKPFTDRFKGVYALQDRLAKGEAIEVPTIAEYFKSESAMGDVLRSAGLGELATQNFLGDVLGRGKSVLEVTNLINDTFNAIDNAPEALKKDLQTYFPGVDRTSLAKALLTGPEGAAELSKKVRMVSSLSAAKSQGVKISEATAQDIANLGYDYGQSLQGFQQVKELERGQMLGSISGIKFGQEEAIGATFKQDAKAMADIERIKKAEAARFAGSAGRLASRSRSQGIF